MFKQSRSLNVKTCALCLVYEHYIFSPVLYIGQPYLSAECSDETEKMNRSVAFLFNRKC